MTTAPLTAAYNVLSTCPAHVEEAIASGDTRRALAECDRGACVLADLRAALMDVRRAEVLGHIVALQAEADALGMGEVSLALLRACAAEVASGKHDARLDAVETRLREMRAECARALAVAS